jgi:hypothetical protein
MSDGDILHPDCQSRKEVGVRMGEYNVKHNKNATCSHDKKGVLGLLRAPLFEKHGTDDWPDGCVRFKPKVTIQFYF